jgi:predicted RNA-binding Zn-ribbon protein involved in translation (DUF1610 family)
MPKQEPAKKRKRPVRCTSCGKELPQRHGGPPGVCPVCGASQAFEEDALARRIRERSKTPFRLEHVFGLLVGGVSGFLFGMTFGAILSRGSPLPLLALYAVLSGLGFAVIGGLVGLMWVVSFTRGR